MLKKFRKLKVIDVLRVVSVFDILVLAILVVLPTLIFAKGSPATTSPVVKIESISPSSGPVGTAVVIYGNGFTTDNQIKVQGKVVARGIPSANGTTIQFIIPTNIACNTSCPIKIEVANRNGGSNAFPFTITQTPPAPTPTPIPFTSITIKGRFVDAFARTPVSGVQITKAVESQDAIIQTGNATGEFLITTTVGELNPTDQLHNRKSFFFWPTCYFYAGTLTVNKPSLSTILVGTDLLDKKSGYNEELLVTSEIVDIGDVPLWPATTVKVTSDKPVKVSIGYDPDYTGLGTANYVTDSAGVLNGGVIPYDYPLTISMTDQTGSVSTTSYTHDKATASSCPAPLTVQYTNGTFSFK